MNNKRIGGVLLFVSFVLLAIFIMLFNSAAEKGEALGCFEQEGCVAVEQKLGLVHVGFGAFGFILALGFYMVFFSRGEAAVLSKLSENEKRVVGEEKLGLVLKGLDEFEREVLIAVRGQEGITQNTLKLRVNMSKAKLSQVLTSLEKKKLVAREKSGKTMTVHSTLEF